MSDDLEILLQFWNSNTFDEIGRLSSYIDFWSEHFRTHQQEIKHELANSINTLRVLENIPSKVTDEEIFLDMDLMDFDEEGQKPWLKAASLRDVLDYSWEYYGVFCASFVIMWYSLVERRLIELCKTLNLLKKQKKTLGVIYRVYKLLNDSIDYRVEQLFWEELQIIGRLRNIIVHNGLDFSMAFSPEDKEEYGKEGIDAFYQDDLNY